MIWGVILEIIIYIFIDIIFAAIWAIIMAIYSAFIWIINLFKNLVKQMKAQPFAAIISSLHVSRRSHQLHQLNQLCPQHQLTLARHVIDGYNPLFCPEAFVFIQLQREVVASFNVPEPEEKTVRKIQ